MGPPDFLVPGGEREVRGAQRGPLAGLRVVVKDVLDLEGTVTAAGNPRLRSTRAPAVASAGCVRAVLAAGATIVGKTRTDELAYSLLGRNLLDGSPTNPRRPGHLTGGSSSGSAAAVAAGFADLGLGTDTGGSIRVPAAWCELVGVRPTHGRVDTSGMVPLAPRFDTVGWLTADVATAVRTAGVLLAGDGRAGTVARAVVARDLLDGVEPAIAASVEAAAAHVSRARPVVVDVGSLPRWRAAFTVLQGAEAWATHRSWIEAEDPPLGDDVAERLRRASEITGDDLLAAEADALRARRRLEELLGADDLLVLPAVTGGPPRADLDEVAATALRQALLLRTCLAPLWGAPAVALPNGVSLVGRPGRDELVLSAASLLHP